MNICKVAAVFALSTITLSGLATELTGAPQKSSNSQSSAVELEEDDLTTISQEDLIRENTPIITRLDCATVASAKVGPERLVFNIIQAGVLPVAEQARQRLREKGEQVKSPKGVILLDPANYNRMAVALCTAAAGIALVSSERNVSSAWMNGLDITVYNEPRIGNAGLAQDLDITKFEIESGLLFDKRTTNDQLALVFAHEFAHGMQDHPRRKIAAAGAGIGVGIGGAAIAYGGGLPRIAVGAVVALGGAYMASCGAARASLDFEQDADILGVRAMSKMMGSLSEAQDAWVEWLNQRTPKVDRNENCFFGEEKLLNNNPHPSMSIRIKAIKAMRRQSVPFLNREQK